MASLLQGAAKLMGALGLLCKCSTPVGFSAEFLAERKKWLETSTRVSVLADLTRSILHGRSNSRAPVFEPAEVASLESVLTAHANQSNCWDQESLEAYLLTQIPNDEKCRALLTSCTPSLWKLLVYFSQWPFISTVPSASTIPKSTTTLAFHALVRGIAFLSGRHSCIFAPYTENEDADVPRRTDRLVLEHIFRALAIDTGQEVPTTWPSLSSSFHPLRDDVLDTLNTAQPALNEFTTLMNRERLVPLAIRLRSSSDDPSPAALSNLAVLVEGPGGMFGMLDLLVPALHHTSKFDKTGIPLTLMKDLETARKELGSAVGISFDAYIKWLADDTLNIYDGLALLFNAFPNPKSLTDGTTINLSGERATLLVYLLRRSGSIRIDS